MVRRSFPPGCPSSGQAVGARCPHALGPGMRVWGPRTVPLACVPCGVLRAAGLAGSCYLGGTPQRCEGRLVSGTLHLRVARPWDGQPGSVAHASWARVVWVCGPSTSPTVCALGSRRCALWDLGEVVAGGGGTSHRCEGRLVPGILPLRPTRPWGGQPGPVACCGDCGRAFPGRVPRAIVRGVCGQDLILPPLPVLGAGSRGLLPIFPGGGCAGVVSVCLRGCVVVRCVLWCRGWRCCPTPPAAPVPPFCPLPPVAVRFVPWCCG